MHILTSLDETFGKFKLCRAVDGELIVTINDVIAWRSAESFDGNCSKRDRDFLSWVADRLVHMKGDDPKADFILRLRKIAGVRDRLEQPAAIPAKESDACDCPHCTADLAQYVPAHLLDAARAEINHLQAEKSALHAKTVIARRNAILEGIAKPKTD